MSVPLGLHSGECRYPQKKDVRGVETMNTRFAGLLSGASLIVIAQVSGAYAQSTPASSSSGDDIETVVVTGTLIHNVIPAGAQPIVLDSSAIQATGATSTDQL